MNGNMNDKMDDVEMKWVDGWKIWWMIWMGKWMDEKWIWWMEYRWMKMKQPT